MKILVTGTRGFIGQNLALQLAEQGHQALAFGRDSDESMLLALLREADGVCHLAGANRPRTEIEFEEINCGLTRRLCELAEQTGKILPIVFSSSSQVGENESPYARSKQQAEKIVIDYGKRAGVSVKILRLPAVFGKWCRPNYNSVVATFCHNIANGLQVSIHDASRQLRLIYVDDLVHDLIRMFKNGLTGEIYGTVAPVYKTTVGELAHDLQEFHRGHDSLMVGDVGLGYHRALYSTYLSYLPTSRFSYRVPVHRDVRGVFCEMLKTPTSGQISFFTALPGITRGKHYHHSKNEKFLVVKGRARFRFRQLLTGERHELETSDEQPEIVETIPGWTHDITNVGDAEMVVVLWANELFDRANPDTFSIPVE
ncbi:MAG: NAD-dependent epimerase/dehydratase family protein [Proteobacteria bacterium]|nr:NAD-dependent epimerase/dehydratase family protein [Pseudomonadota bacterium]